MCYRLLGRRSVRVGGRARRNDVLRLQFELELLPRGVQRDLRRVRRGRWHVRFPQGFLGTATVRRCSTSARYDHLDNHRVLGYAEFAVA
jgi:hypothetical protein